MQQSPKTSQRLALIAAAVFVLNIAATIYLFNRVMTLEQRVGTLEHNDAVTKTVENLKSDVSSIRERLRRLLP